MKRIVLTTSSAGLDNYNIPHNIGQIRLHFHINNAEYIDGETINSSQLSQFISENPHASVTTTPATRNEVASILTKLKQQGYDEVFITCLSSQISDSYKIIRQVSYMFRNSMKIYVYDCKGLNVCEALLALEAEQMLNKGSSFTEIANRLDALRQNHKMLFAINDSDYYIASNSSEFMSSTKELFTKALDIKPILEMTQDGSLITTGKTRSFKKAIKYIVDAFSANIGHQHSFAYILNAGDNELATHLVNYIKKEYKVTIPVLPASSVSIVNHGVHGVGLCAFNHPPESARLFAS